VWYEPQKGKLLLTQGEEPTGVVPIYADKLVVGKKALKKNAWLKR
jgi:hypothetical protein